MKLGAKSDNRPCDLDRHGFRIGRVGGSELSVHGIGGWRRWSCSPAGRHIDPCGPSRRPPDRRAGSDLGTVPDFDDAIVINGEGMPDTMYGSVHYAVLNRHTHARITSGYVSLDQFNKVQDIEKANAGCQ